MVRKEATKDLNEGFPQLNFDTLASDQVVAVTVEDFGIEEVEMCLKSKENDGMSLKGAAEDVNVVDEEGSPQLNYDALLSDGASAVTVDVNSVVAKDIPPPQFSATAQQDNPDEDFGNEELWEDDAKHLKGGTLQNTSRGGLAESNVDVNTSSDQTSSKKRSTSVSGKGETKTNKPRSTKPTNENKGEVPETVFRSSLRGIIMLIKELNLRTCHKKVLKRTPFWGIFEAIIENKLSTTQCRKSDKMIIEIINTYDPVAQKFRLGMESVELTPADMVSIFGISCGNECVSLKYACQEKVELVARRKISKRLTSTSLKQHLRKYVASDEKDDIEDVARLLYVYLCHTFFFPTATTVKWVYLNHVEDLDRLRGYDWNGAIINELMSSITKHLHEPAKVKGCVMALLYWLCEHTNLSEALDPEHPLGIVKWNISKVVSNFKKTRLKDLKAGQVVSRQANIAGTANDEVPVEYMYIVQDSVSSGDVPASNQGNDACSEAGLHCDEALPSPSNRHDCDDEPNTFTDMVGIRNYNGPPPLDHASSKNSWQSAPSNSLPPSSPQSKNHGEVSFAGLMDPIELEGLLCRIEKPGAQTTPLLSNMAAFHLQTGLVISLKSSPSLDDIITLVNGIFSSLKSLDVDINTLYEKVKAFVKYSALWAKVGDTSNQGLSLEELEAQYEVKRAQFGGMTNNYDKTLSIVTKHAERVTSLEDEISRTKEKLKSLEYDLSLYKDKQSSSQSDLVKFSEHITKSRKDLNAAKEAFEQRKKKGVHRDAVKEALDAAKASLMLLIPHHPSFPLVD
ncbi:hypothetical protein Vadar_009125 [Vaccinium darrowii]|uniref:Uncharacterized protein n=1 Tax=Vaccinium darrowii TaxID=229202 RepID=A0ACB7YV14_9ERIC|nr:hypothetical protein Vadar_009125 [Vaccinium darrowii]